MTVRSILVVASTDDCYVWWDGVSAWDINLTNTNLEAGYYSTTSFKNGTGMRFRGLNIPKGSTINTSYITFTCKTSRSGTTVNTKLCCELTGTPATFGTLANYQARRGTACGGADDSQHTATIDWTSIPAWTADATYNTPSLNTPIQTVVNSYMIQDLVIFWDDHDGLSTASSARRREPYSQNGSATKCPLLYIDYTAPASINNVPRMTRRMLMSP